MKIRQRKQKLYLLLKSRYVSFKFEQPYVLGAAIARAIAHLRARRQLHFLGLSETGLVEPRDGILAGKSMTKWSYAADANSPLQQDPSRVINAAATIAGSVERAQHWLINSTLRLGSG